MADDLENRHIAWISAWGVIALVAVSMLIWSLQPRTPGFLPYAFVVLLLAAVYMIFTPFLHVWPFRRPRGVSPVAVTAPAAADPQARQEPQPLRPEYHRHQVGRTVEHRIGIHNPPGNPEAHGVRLRWKEMSGGPGPDADYPPEFPQPVPMVTGGDPSIGFDLPADREEIWVIVTTVTYANGVTRAGVFSGHHPDWHGPVWPFRPDDRWRFSYKIAADDMPSADFSVVMTAEDGIIRCELQG